MYVCVLLCLCISKGVLFGGGNIQALLDWTAWVRVDERAALEVAGDDDDGATPDNRTIKLCVCFAPHDDERVGSFRFRSRF